MARAAQPVVWLSPLMAVLTLATGMIEAASLLALGPVFTGMQTGNVLFLAFGLLGQGGLSVVAPAVSLGAFVAGAVLGARVEWRLEEARQRWFIAAVLTEAVLVAVAALTAWGLEPSHGMPTARHLTTIGVLSGAMGLRNVTAMRAAVPDMPTTLVTRAMTAFLGGSLLGHDPSFGHTTAASLRRAASVAAMFAGGAAGAAFVRLHWPLHLLLLAAAALALLVALATSRRPLLTTH
ncbi:YoaK family protein [Streptomyces sp. NPDC089919]|uniref:YoaK family protein n=1 Tax=Streptomyces sp. NPDC089919 TaxID=3155188 RepID=UPI0034224F0B